MGDNRSNKYEHSQLVYFRASHDATTKFTCLAGEQPGDRPGAAGWLYADPTGGEYTEPTADLAALPKDQRDALLNDPKALTRLLKTHVVEGYSLPGSLSGATGHSDYTLTNLLGQKLILLASTINGLQVTEQSYNLANGNRVQSINKLLPVK